MQRSGRGEVAEAVMVDDAVDGGVLKAVHGLGRLVVVAQDHELRIGALGSRLDGVEQRGLGNAQLVEELRGLSRQRAQAAGLVGMALVLKLVEQLGQDDGGQDAVVIGVLMTKNENVAHGSFLSTEYVLICMVHKNSRGDTPSPAAASYLYRTAQVESRRIALVTRPP